jgi:CelD/BcsL family acetyltransferase involved in cellulose biosynthesis
MVDAAAVSLEAGSGPPAPTGVRTIETACNAVVHLDPSEALQAYASACTAAVVSSAQSFAWISAWVAHTQPDFLVAALTCNDTTVFAAALEVTRSGPFSVARVMGGRHANGNFPPLAWNTNWRIAPDDLGVLIDVVKRARPDIDMLAFERVADRMDGQENPLFGLPHSPSANLSLAADLAGGFDDLLSRVSGKRKRKKHRSQARKFEAAGGFRRIEARTSAETNALLEAFFFMKEQRFRKVGIANVFAEPAIQSFFRTLFAHALKAKEPAFILHGLEVGGNLCAVTGSSRTSQRLTCEFGSIAEDELAHASPGDFLFFENIREACENGYKIYDFGVGDDPVQAPLVRSGTTQFDVFVPLTIKGQLLPGSMRVANWLKSFVKNSPAIWRIAKTLRRRGSSVKAQQD